MLASGSQLMFDKLRLRLLRATVEHQIGAIPYTIVDGQVVFLIITSRRTGRWIFPKGSKIDGMTNWDAARKEALEEAGVEGDIAREPVGRYRTIKKRSLARSVIDVELYPLRVTTQLPTWQEQESRHRHWVLLPEARRLLSDPKLADLAAIVARRALGLATA